MHISAQKNTKLKSYDGLTKRGQARRLRKMVESALVEFNIRTHRLDFIKHLDNTTFRLWSDEGQFLVRVHRLEGYTSRSVDSELAWLNALSKDSNVRVQTPRQTPDGRGTVTVETHGVPNAYPVTVLSWLKGRIVHQERRTMAHFEALGRLVGELHKHAMQWVLPNDFERPIYDAVHQLGTRSPTPLSEVGPKYLPVHILRDVETAYVRRLDVENVLGTGKEQFGLVHFDLCVGNILFNKKEAIAIDFDQCGLGFYAYDLAVALMGPFAGRNFMGSCEALFRGYREVQPLPAEWIDHLPTMMASRSAGFILRVAHRNPKMVLKLWRAFLRPLLEATPDQFPT